MESTTQQINREENDRLLDGFDPELASIILGNPAVARAIESVASRRRQNARIRATQHSTDDIQFRQEQGKVQELNWWAGLIHNARVFTEKHKEKQTTR